MVCSVVNYICYMPAPLKVAFMAVALGEPAELYSLITLPPSTLQRLQEGTIYENLDE
jgi:hypothetical protein